MSNVYGYCSISSIPLSRTITKQNERIRVYYRKHLAGDHVFLNTYADDDYSRIRLPLVRRPLGNLLDRQLRETDIIILPLLSSVGSLKETVSALEQWRRRGIDIVTLRPRIVSQRHWRDWLGAAKDCLDVAQVRQLELVAIGRREAKPHDKRLIRRVPLMSHRSVLGELTRWTMNQLELDIANRCMTALEAGESLDTITDRECLGPRTKTFITAARLWRSVLASVPEPDRISTYRKCWHSGKLLSSS